MTELVAAQLYRAPFENVSKVYYQHHQGLRGLPSLEQYLDGIEQHHFGGTCYVNNFHLNGLLNHLGYAAHLCGADMNRPDVHLVNIVQVEGREYLVDVGYGAPFDRPLPRDLTDAYVITCGRDQYILQPRDERGRSRLDLVRNGQHKHGYDINPTPRHIDEFQGVIQHSYRAEATFMNTLLIARFFPRRSLVVHNFTVIEAEGTHATSRVLASDAELAAFVAQQMEMPRDIVQDVIAHLGGLHGDAWG
ncbi:MAG: arylamine N-acetyltransferase [Chloroflexi bacterium]|nr:arylamine N-acetyltransferase [Chloroflexota bacterium]